MSDRFGMLPSELGQLSLASLWGSQNRVPALIGGVKAGKVGYLCCRAAGNTVILVCEFIYLLAQIKSTQ